MQRRKPGEHPVSHGTDKLSLNLVLLGVNRISMNLSMARQRNVVIPKVPLGWRIRYCRHERGVNSESRTIAASTLVRETMTAQIGCSIVISFALQ